MKISRMRRYRRTENIRLTFADVGLTLHNLVYPLFILDRIGKARIPVDTMPGINQYSIEAVTEHVAELVNLGVKNYILFGVPSKKDKKGTGAWAKEGPVPQAIERLKDQFGTEITLYADVCLCEYTSHGHCGVLDANGNVLNDESLLPLSKAAVTYANAGADWVAPSNMMDFRVKSIRDALDDNGHKEVAILSYSAKFASNYYGPFRDAAGSAPSFGNRKSYQIDYRNSRQPLREIKNDEMQGADAVMVKPALPYLDIIAKAKERTYLPLYAYNVSGEYSLVKFGAKSGLFDERSIVMENLMAIKRAGADAIISYHVQDIARNDWLEETE